MNSPLLPPGSLEAALFDLTARSFRIRPPKAARALGATRGEVQKAIKRLEAMRLAFTLPDPHDERQRVLCLTDDGQTYAAAARMR